MILIIKVLTDNNYVLKSICAPSKDLSIFKLSLRYKSCTKLITPFCCTKLTTLSATTIDGEKEKGRERERRIEHK